MGHYRGPGRHLYPGGLLLNGENGLRCPYGPFDSPLPAPTADAAADLCPVGDHHPQDQCPHLQPAVAGRLRHQYPFDDCRLLHRGNNERGSPLDPARPVPAPALRGVEDRHRALSRPAAGRSAEYHRQDTDHPLAQPLPVEASRSEKDLARGNLADSFSRTALLRGDLPGAHLLGRAGILHLMGNDADRTGSNERAPETARAGLCRRDAGRTSQSGTKRDGRRPRRDLD